MLQFFSTCKIVMKKYLFAILAFYTVPTFSNGNEQYSEILPNEIIHLIWEKVIENDPNFNSIKHFVNCSKKTRNGFSQNSTLQKKARNQAIIQIQNHLNEPVEKTSHIPSLKKIIKTSICLFNFDSNGKHFNIKTDNDQLQNISLAEFFTKRNFGRDHMEIEAFATSSFLYFLLYECGANIHYKDNDPRKAKFETALIRCPNAVNGKKPCTDGNCEHGCFTRGWKHDKTHFLSSSYYYLYMIKQKFCYPFFDDTANEEYKSTLTKLGFLDSLRRSIFALVDRCGLAENYFIKAKQYFPKEHLYPADIHAINNILETCLPAEKTPRTLSDRTTNILLGKKRAETEGEEKTRLEGEEKSRVEGEKKSREQKAFLKKTALLFAIPILAICAIKVFFWR